MRPRPPLPDLRHAARRPLALLTRAAMPLAALALIAAGALLAPPANTDSAPVTLKTLELGRGSTLVFVHDLGMSRMTWLPMARKMIGDQRVVLVDLPGHGESPMPTDFSLDVAAAALDRVLAREKPESTVVVGHGLGGLVALIEARAHPERMRGVVLVSAAFRVGTGIPDQQRKQFIDFVEQRYDDFIKGMFTQISRDSAQGVAMHAQATRVPKAAMMAYLRELLGTDTAALTKAVKTPLLVVATERDTLAARDSTAFVKQLGFDAATSLTMTRIATSGHYVMVDQPDSLRLTLVPFTARAIAKR